VPWPVEGRGLASGNRPERKMQYLDSTKRMRTQKEEKGGMYRRPVNIPKGVSSQKLRVVTENERITRMKILFGSMNAERGSCLSTFYVRRRNSLRPIYCVVGERVTEGKRKPNDEVMEVKITSH